METNCCGASFYEPGYPDNDICTACGEHASPMEEEEQDDTNTDSWKVWEALI